MVGCDSQYLLLIVGPKFLASDHWLFLFILKYISQRSKPSSRSQAVKNKSFPCSNGLQLRDFLYVGDAINAILKCLQSKQLNGQILNIGFGKPSSVKKVINKICELLNSGKPQFGKIKLRRDEIMKLYPSTIKAKKILNWKPRISLESGLKKTINFFRKWKKLV